MLTVVKLDALTSLRFFAAAMIVLGHSHRLFGSLGIANTISLAQGVSFFFVLSGFILAYNYPKISSIVEIAAFFKARFARIWPAHIASILLLVLLTSNFNVGGLTRNEAIFAGTVNLFLIQSIIPFKDVFLAFNGVAWSISTEMFFYLAFPLLMPNILPGWKVKLAFLASIAFMYIWFGVAWKIPVDESVPQLNLMGLLYVNPLVRVLEFFLGVIACNSYLSLKARASDQTLSASLFTIAEMTVLVFVLFSMWLSPRVTSYLEWYGDIATVVNYYLSKSGSGIVFALLIFIFAFGKGVVSRTLALSPFVFLGEISFALYLVHTTILNWYEINLGYFSSWPDSAKVFMYWILTLTIATLLHKAIEVPFRKLILSFKNVKPREIIDILFSGRQLAFIATAVFVLVSMKMFTSFIPSFPLLTLSEQLVLVW